MTEDFLDIDDFLTPEEFDIIENFTKKILEVNGTERNKNTSVGFQYEKSLVKRLLNEKLDALLAPFRVHVSLVLHEVSPWAIHTDWHKNDDHPYCALLFPIEYHEKVTHTVIFNEEAYNDDWKEYVVRKGGILDKSTLDLLSHISKNNFNFVSLKKKIKWKKNKLIAWDRKLLHCSDNFIDSGLSYKRAMILFLSRV